MGWKYIIVKNVMSQGGVEFMLPIIFSDKLVHSQVYQHLRPVMPGWHAQGVKPISAGTISHVEVEGLGGSSDTLNLSSNPEDAKLIRTFEYFHGVVA